MTLPPGGTSMVNDTVPVVAKSSGPRAVPSGLVPKASVPATSAGTAARRDRVDRIGPAAPRPRPAGGAVTAAAAASTAAPCVPRPKAAGARVTRRGFRQITTGVTPGFGLTSVNDKKTFTGPGVTGAPRPRPARAPSPYVKG